MTENITSENVTYYYPEITNYWIEKGMPRKHIEIFRVLTINEDCLYLYGRFFSYCKNPSEWKLKKDLTKEEKNKIIACSERK